MQEEQQGVPPRPGDTSAMLAERVLDLALAQHAADRKDHWPLATASEASLAMHVATGSPEWCDRAELWLHRFLNHPSTDAFSVESYFRQLRETLARRPAGECDLRRSTAGHHPAARRTDSATLDGGPGEGAGDPRSSGSAREELLRREDVHGRDVDEDARAVSEHRLCDRRDRRTARHRVPDGRGVTRIRQSRPRLRHQRPRDQHHVGDVDQATGRKSHVRGRVRRGRRARAARDRRSPVLLRSRASSVDRRPRRRSSTSRSSRSAVAPQTSPD